MARGNPSRLGLLLMALVVAMVMQLVPLFGPSAMWRPQLVQLVVIFFLLTLPLRYGIACAWTVGVVLDIFYGGVFGRYALALGVSAYLFMLLRPRLQHARIWHQCGLVLVLVAAAQLIVAAVNVLTQDTASWMTIWMPAVSSSLIWPLVYWLLMRLQRA